MKKITKHLFILMLLSSTTVLASPIEVQQQHLIKSTLPKNAIRVPFLRINISTSELNQSLKTLTLKRTGLSSHKDLGRIWAETDDYRRSNSRQLNNDDQVELSFRTPLKIEPNQSKILTIYANLNSNGNNRTIGLALIDVNNKALISKENQTTIPKTKKEALVVPPQKKYDRSKFRIKCQNSRCQLIPRN